MKLSQAAPVCLAIVVLTVSVSCQAEDAIPLDSKNFTEISNNCAGNYTQIEDFEARHISSDLFPLCNNGSQPFSGELHHGGGYRIQNLNIAKPGETAALFGIIDGASIDVIVQNSTVSGRGAATIAAEVRSNNRVNVVFYDGGVVTGETVAAMMALYVTGNTNSLVQTAGNNSTLTIEARSTDAGAYVGAGGFTVSVDGDHNHFEQQGGVIVIDAKATGAQTNEGGMIVLLTGLNNTAIQNGTRLTAEGDFTGGGIQEIQIGSAYNTLIQTNASINVMGANRAAGMIQRIGSASHNTAVQTYNQIRVTGFDSAAGAVDRIGGSSLNNTIIQTDNQMNVMANGPGSLANGGFRLTGSAPDNTLIQTGNQMNISGKGVEATAFISSGAASQGTQLLLYSGGLYADRNTPTCDTIANEAATGLIDIAGYNVDAQSCIELDVALLNSTLPDHWHRAQQMFCHLDPRARACSEEQETSCHYPHEQLQAVVHAGNDALWLVTRQRYPFNPDADKTRAVRITRYLVNNATTQSGITPDNSFSLENTRVLTPSSFNTEPLPDTWPIARIADQNRLSLLYFTPENEGVLLANFPLSQATGNEYHLHIIDGPSGQPVLLSQNKEEDKLFLWTREQNEVSDILQRYTLSFENFFRVPDAEYNLNNTAYSDAPVIGLGFDSQWLYIARHHNSNVVVERIDLHTEQQDNWTAELKEVPVALNSTGLSYHLRPAGNRLYLVPVLTEAPLSDFSSEPLAFSVEVPWFGGCAEWTSHTLQSVVLYELPVTSSVLTSMATPVPTASPALPHPDPENPDHTGIILGSVLGGGAAIAIAVVAGIALIKIKNRHQKH